MPKHIMMWHTVCWQARRVPNPGGSKTRPEGAAGVRAVARPGAVLCVLVAAWLASGCGESPVDKVRSEDQAARLEGIQQLARQDTRAAVEELSRAAAHEDLTTARAAVRAISRMVPTKSVPVLARVAASDPRPAVREEAVLALGFAGVAASADDLRRIVRTDESARVRAAAATALGRVGRLTDVDLLLGVAAGDAEPLVRGRAIGAVERLLGIGFTFDPDAPPEDRKVTLDRIREAARIRASVLARRVGREDERRTP